MSASSPATREYLRVEGVEKRFGAGVLALDGVSLAADRGTFVSLLGPSGSGKSTLLSIIAGLTSATRGRVEIGGKVVAGPHSAAGVVFQKDLLLDWRTALDNVLMQFRMRGDDPRPHRERARELLDMVGVGAFADAYPRQLSGGMRQRVALCRALVHDPDLLLMDEPFGALDAITREQVTLDLGRIAARSGKTVVFVTHSIEEAVFLADTVIVMSARPGRIVARIDVPMPRADRVWPRGESAFTPYMLEARAALERGGAYARISA